MNLLGSVNFYPADQAQMIQVCRHIMQSKKGIVSVYADGGRPGGMVYEDTGICAMQLSDPGSFVQLDRTGAQFSILSIRAITDWSGDVYVRSSDFEGDKAFQRVVSALHIRKDVIRLRWEESPVGMEASLKTGHYSGHFDGLTNETGHEKGKNRTVSKARCPQAKRGPCA